MKKTNMDSEQNKSGLFYVISRLDTQSAIVAAVVISVITFLCAGLIDLCNYIYWSAYFSSFRIPMAYIDQAIIHENGIKYTVALCIPLIAFTWWLLYVLKKALSPLLARVTQKRKNRRFPLIEKILVCLGMLLNVLCLTLVGLLVMGWSIEREKSLLFVLYIEFAVFVLWTLFRASIGKWFVVSKKSYYIIRIVGCFIMAYLLLGSVYFAGSFGNYSRYRAQNLQILCDSKVGYSNPAEDDSLDARLVLLETEEYYYVREVSIQNVGSLQVQIWNGASSSFVDKGDCPVQSVYAELWIMSGRRHEPMLSGLFEEYLLASLIFTVAFIALLSVPMSLKKPEEKNKLQAENDVQGCCVPVE